MLPKKRKSATGDGTVLKSSKKAKLDKDQKSQPMSESPRQRKHESNEHRKSSHPISVLATEQPAFPRGGGGILTPLERKQIAVKAGQDAKAEHGRFTDLFKTSNGQANKSESDSDLDKLESAHSDVSSRRARIKQKDKHEKTSRLERAIPIESLSYKRLAVGSLLLGQIASVNIEDLAISLPNNLTGYVTRAEISQVFSQKLQHAISGVDDAKDEESNAEHDEISLNAHFRPGQLVRVSVISLGSDSLGISEAKKRIGLSIDPRKTNIGLSSSTLTVGCTVQGAVLSVEDHGLVMDIATEGSSSTRGFIPSMSIEDIVPMDQVRKGAVLLCAVTSLGRTIKLSPKLSGEPPLRSSSNIHVILPGTMVDILLTGVATDGLTGKVMGLVDATADIVHSGSFQDRESFVERYKIGQKLIARVITTFPDADPPKLGVSVLSHVVGSSKDHANEPGHDELAISSIVPAAKVIRVVPGIGIYLSLAVNKVGFAHISRLSDKRVESLSETVGTFKLQSEHQARILDYNALDGLFLMSLQKRVIEQPFLRVEDVRVGEVVKGTIEKVLVVPGGIKGVIVQLADGVSGLVPEMHLSDVTLLHPEKKFREGAAVTCRVLSVDAARRQIRLTMKKTIVNSDQPIWQRLEDVSIGDSTLGTLVKIDTRGALVQFFANVRGFLPVSEMSEAYIKDATEHFKVGQVLTVNAISVNMEEGRLTVSCRERSASSEDALASVKLGSVVNGVVFEKSQHDILLRLEASDIIGRLALDHVSDGSEKRRKSALEKVRVGQRLENVLVLDIQRRGRLVVLSNKQSLVKAAQNGQFLNSLEDLREGNVYTGFVSNITDAGAFIQFAGGISGLVAKHQVPVQGQNLPNFGLQSLQAVTATVSKIDYRGATPRFWLTTREISQLSSLSKEAPDHVNLPNLPLLVDPFDNSIRSYAEFRVGKVTKAQITSIKETQINAELAKGIQARIDVSELFDSWDEIKDRKQPLNVFTARQILDVRILGAHDSRNHRFLPLSHRGGKNTVFELTAKSSVVQASELRIQQLSDLSPGSSVLAYVNNVLEDSLMVNISPSIRGRIKAVDVSDDLTLASNLEANFPVGSVLKARVVKVDVDRNRLDLTAKSGILGQPLTFDELSVGMLLPGRVTKTTDRSVIVQLGENLVGVVELIDVADDYTKANTTQFEKNEVMRVCVVRLDAANKKINLSVRPSRILSSSLEIVDPEITSTRHLHVNQIVRGFIVNVSDKGVFVGIGHGITAFVRVTNLSDAYLKAWKDNFQRDQLVQGKIISIDNDTGRLQLSLKRSLMDKTYEPPRTFTEMQVGEIVSGKVVKVEVFGVFILVDNSDNVRGLCHRSEIADQRIEDASKLFEEGDMVKAKVIKLDLQNRRINFGMKASYFTESESGDDYGEQFDTGESDGDVGMDSEIDDLDDAGASLRPEEDHQGLGIVAKEVFGDLSGSEDGLDDGENAEANQGTIEDISGLGKGPAGLSVGGFDWYGTTTQDTSLKHAAEISASDDTHSKPKKRKRVEILVDKTGDMDTHGPQSADDFERLLLGEPSSSILWLQYMAFYLELGDIDQARSIGERGLKTIGLGQDREKLNVWIALLNLENTYGDDGLLESIFERALQYNDHQEVYTRLVSIYIQSGKHDKASDLFQEMLKKFPQDPKSWVNYATFLFDTKENAHDGRALLPKAIQVLPAFTHFDLTTKFALLEFKSRSGLAERGRTIFEGLVNSFPKRIDLYNVMLDMEIMRNGKDEDSTEQIRSLFVRIFEKKLKPKQAKHFFKRWLSFEEGVGDDRKIEEVKAKAATWVKAQG